MLIGTPLMNFLSPYKNFLISREKPSHFLVYTHVLEIPSQTSDFNHFNAFSCSPFSKENFSIRS